MPQRAFGSERPPVWVGVTIAALAVALATLAVYPLKTLAPVVSLSVVYLPAVLLVSVYWGLLLGLLTSLASAAALNFFHIPPIGRFTIADSRNWVALAAFVLVAAVVSAVADLARGRALEAERGRHEADLVADLARELLGGSQTEEALGATARRVAQAMGLRSAAIVLGARPSGMRQLALPIRSADGTQLATLIVSRALRAETIESLQERVIPAVGALVAIALHRDAMQAEAVETAALRRSDELKTSLLQAVSHDLRTPVTAVVTAGHALGSKSLTEDERRELSAAVVDEGARLSALIDKLLDLSRLQAGRAEPRRDWISLEEVLLVARDAQAGPWDNLHIVVDPDVPPIRADAAQLEHVFTNLLENARRYSDRLPVFVYVRRIGQNVVVRVVDQGPGIRRAEQERIFEPFYRGAQPAASRWTGSGLGLAIAKGFVEANGGTISVDSLPGQGTSFVVELPVPDEPMVPVA
jgi:two-component system sensor histidine kinase KdpD